MYILHSRYWNWWDGIFKCTINQFSAYACAAYEQEGSQGRSYGSMNAEQDLAML